MNWICRFEDQEEWLFQAYPGNAHDLRSRTKVLLREPSGRWLKVVQVPLGIKSALQAAVELRERSSMTLFYPWLALGGGVIDPDYRGEWRALFRIHPHLFDHESPDPKGILQLDPNGALYLKAHQRVAQVLLPPWEAVSGAWETWEKRFPSARSTAGFGSTGTS